MDAPLDNSDMEIFTDGNSFVQDGKLRKGYAVVTARQVSETGSPHGNECSTNGACGSDPNSGDKQKAVSKYTDSKYAYLTSHDHATP